MCLATVCTKVGALGICERKRSNALEGPGGSDCGAPQAVEMTLACSHMTSTAVCAALLGTSAKALEVLQAKVHPCTPHRASSLSRHLQEPSRGCSLGHP